LFRSIYRSQGVQGLYRGWSAVVLTRASNFAYFGAYAQAQTQLAPHSSSRVLNAVLAGGLSGICYWLVAFPFDVVKAKMMMPQARSLGLVACARDVYAKDGLRGFTRGFSPTAIRAFPANAAAFFAFEAASQALGAA
jgi:solute carrier family 25 carnitine/acylcarnitine transporter 20/29